MEKIKITNKIKILNELKRSKFGLTITQLTKQISISRSSIRTALAFLEGAEKVEFENIGMAKIYRIKE